jgi:serine/threonine protein kinase/formylglycine-generating enzyme required for sulfatase activity
MQQKDFFERYEIDIKSGRLGGGAFGTVYKAYDHLRDEWKAVKIAEVKFIDGKEFSLISEFNASQAIPLHKNIAHYESVFQFQMTNGVFDYAIMQYYPEGNLKQLLNSKTLQLDEKFGLVNGLLQGITFLHKNSIIHRDIKPSNILISIDTRNQYVPKIADFGLSKNISDADFSNITNSFGGGTLDYSSPEQLFGHPLRPNSDLWSFGVIVYEIFMGKKPFESDDVTGSPEAKRRMVYQNIIQAILPANVDQCPHPYNDVIRLCLIKDSTKRVKKGDDIIAFLKNPVPVFIPNENNMDDETLVFPSSGNDVEDFDPIAFFRDKAKEILRPGITEDPISTEEKVLQQAEAAAMKAKEEQRNREKKERAQAEAQKKAEEQLKAAAEAARLKGEQEKKQAEEIARLIAIEEKQKREQQEKKDAEARRIEAQAEQWRVAEVARLKAAEEERIKEEDRKRAEAKSREAEAEQKRATEAARLKEEEEKKQAEKTARLAAIEQQKREEQERSEAKRKEAEDQQKRASEAARLKEEEEKKQAEEITRLAAIEQQKREEQERSEARKKEAEAEQERAAEAARLRAAEQEKKREAEERKRLEQEKESAEARKNEYAAEKERTAEAARLTSITAEAKQAEKEKKRRRMLLWWTNNRKFVLGLLLILLAIPATFYISSRPPDDTSYTISTDGDQQILMRGKAIISGRFDTIYMKQDSIIGVNHDSTFIFDQAMQKFVFVADESESVSTPVSEDLSAEKEKAAEEAYKKIIKTPRDKITIPMLENYIKDFPESKRIKEIKALKDKIIQEIADKMSEDGLYQQAVSAQSITYSEAYLDKYPKGKYSKEISGLLLSLKQKAEDALWQSLMADPTIAGMDAYLYTYPNGKYKSQAIQKKNDIAEQKTKEKEAKEKADIQAQETIMNTAKAETENKPTDTNPKDKEPAPVEVPTKVKAIDQHFVKIQGGSYTLGCVANEKGCDAKEGTKTVQINDFMMSKFEMSQELYQSITGKNPSFYKDNKKNPVENISYQEILDFIAKLNAVPGTPYTYRLPTEGEWEYAANAGSDFEYAGGNNAKAVSVTEETGSSVTGRKKANKWGLYDMSGNVAEFCQDSYGDFKGGKNNAKFKVVRGGSYRDNESAAKIKNRSKAETNRPFTFIGFRLVRELK